MTTAATRREQRLHRFFEITLLLKAIFAAGEIVAALGVYVAPLDRVADFVGSITHAELMRHPHDPTPSPSSSSRSSFFIKYTGTR